MPPIAKPKRDRSKHFIKEWRKHSGLTQEQAAEMIPMSRENFSKIENGVVPYSQDFLEAAASAFKCSPGDLIMRDPANPMWTVLESLRDLDQNDLKQVLAIIRTFKPVS